MAIIKQIFMQCDKCSETFPDSVFDSTVDCLEDAKSSGWKLYSDDICPTCVEKLAAEKRGFDALRKEKSDG